MLSAEIRCRVASACVTVATRGHEGGAQGRGVLVPGGMILTAAHIVAHAFSGGQQVGKIDLSIPGRALTLPAAPLVADLASDIAVLRAVNGVDDPDPLDFETWRSCTAPVPLRRMNSPVFRGANLVFGPPLRIAVYTHLGTWLVGTAKAVVVAFRGDAGLPRLELSVTMEPGTSGSPVVGGGGTLLGIVSTTDTAVMPQVVLPAWALRRMKPE